MLYTNMSLITKTFHGVTLRPGETKEIPGIVNDPKVLRSSKRQEPPKRSRRVRSKVDSLVDSLMSTATSTAEGSDITLTESTSDSLENSENKEV